MAEREVRLEELEHERLLRLRAELELAEVRLRQAREQREAAEIRFREFLGVTCKAHGVTGTVDLDLEAGTLNVSELN